MSKILCVDDESCVLECLEKMLNARGYEVLGSGDPVAVDGLVEEHAFDLVILDVEMPERDGLQVFDQLKERYHNLPMLFVTGKPHSFDWDTEEQKERWNEGFIDGLTDVLYKPFRTDDLYDKVEALIGPA